MKILKLIILSLFFIILLCGCDKKVDFEIPTLTEKYEIVNKNLMNRFDEHINFNGKQKNVSILEYESYEREIKIDELSINIPARFVGFLYENIVAMDLDNDNIQELLVYFNSSGSAGCKGLIILKVKDNNIIEIPMPMHDDLIGLRADLNFTDNFEVIVSLIDYSKTLKLKLDEKVITELKANGIVFNNDLSKGIDCASIIETQKNLNGEYVIKIYQRIWAPVHVQRIGDLVTTIKIDNGKSKIVNIYLLK
jgi:hypothetical protein